MTTIYKFDTLQDNTGFDGAEDFANGDKPLEAEIEMGLMTGMVVLHGGGIEIVFNNGGFNADEEEMEVWTRLSGTTGPAWTKETAQRFCHFVARAETQDDLELLGFVQTV